MTRPQIDFASPDDDAAIRSLLRRERMPGRIRVTFEREPDFWLGCRATGQDFHVPIARDLETSEVVGVACRSTRTVFINGIPRRLGYLGQLRIDARFRGQWLVSRGFAKLKLLHDQDPLPAYLVSIVDENREAAGVLVQRRRRGFPLFHLAADFRTLAIFVNRSQLPRRSAATITPARTDDVKHIVAFLNLHGSRRQFSSVWTAEDLARLGAFGLTIQDLRVARKEGEIVGVSGLWDQSAYKQTVVHCYSGWLKFAAPLYNMSAPLIGKSKLPSAGEKLLSAYASPFCVANNDLDVSHDLLRDLLLCSESRGLRTLLIGFDCRDPLLSAAASYRHIVYPSRIYLAEWPDGGSVHEQLDPRPACVDIATL